jgi:y4mF family transcriptional regulator
MKLTVVHPNVIFLNGNMHITDATKLGDLVRSERKRLKVTQKDLAMTSGTGLRFISDLENGKVTCQVGKVLRVLQTLGLQVEVVRP